MKQRETNKNIFFIRARTWARVCINFYGFIFFVCSLPASQAAQRKNDSGFQVQNRESDLESSDKTKRLQAAQNLHGKNDQVTQGKIKTARENETDPLIRHRLNQAMAESSMPEAEKELLITLKSDTNPMVRQGAAQMLGNYSRNPIVIRALADALRDDQDPAVRYAAANSLAISKSFKAMSTLEKYLDDPDANLRRQIAFSLARQDAPRAKILLKKLQSDQDESVRKMAGAK